MVGQVDDREPDADRVGQEDPADPPERPPGEQEAEEREAGMERREGRDLVRVDVVDRVAVEVVALEPEEAGQLVEALLLEVQDRRPAVGSGQVAVLGRPPRGRDRAAGRRWRSRPSPAGSARPRSRSRPAAGGATGRTRRRSAAGSGGSRRPSPPRRGRPARSPGGARPGGPGVGQVPEEQQPARRRGCRSTWTARPMLSA